MAALAAGYVGVYLCRKNLAVAVPLLQQAFGASKEQVGRIASVGTLAYAVGKLVGGPVTDRIGGRAGFLLALFGVALCGAAGGLAPGLTALTLLYGMNRLAGAGGWGAMMKLVPTWFPQQRHATVIGLLSLSYVAGGAAATLLGREILRAGGGWRAVMGMPAAILLIIALLCLFIVQPGPLHRPLPGQTPAAATGRPWQLICELLANRRFLVVCALSFSVTLMREAFNTWSVDFLMTTQRAARSVSAAALQSIGFDVAGALSIVFTGYVYDRMRPQRKGWLMAGMLALLALVLMGLPSAARAHPFCAPWLIGAVGLFVYGPYSLLAGALAVESGGARAAATAAGLVDAVGYVAGVLAGAGFGRLLDIGGYALGFGTLAAVTALSAAVALQLRPAARAAT